MSNESTRPKQITRHELARKARSDFTAFCMYMRPDYVHEPYLDILNKTLMEVARFIETGEGINKLIIEMPPRHGKSTAVSQLFPAWLVGRNPSMRGILASYGSDMAKFNSRIARNYVLDPKFKKVFPRVKMSEDLAKIEEWTVKGVGGVEGGWIAVGMGGAVTGKGANLLVVDDPHKNRNEAESETMRNMVWNSYESDFLSRFDNRDRGAIIIMATRWHTDDLTGRLLKADRSAWTRLRLPALAELNDPLGREYDTNLSDRAGSTEALQELRATMSEYAWSSLYQQRPIPLGATTIDHTKIMPIHIDLVPELESVVRFYDLAVTTNKTSDYTVGLKMGIDKNENIYILDVWRQRAKAPDALQAIIHNAQIDGRGTRIILEAEKSGISTLDFMMGEPMLRGFDMSLQPIKGDKLARSGAISTRIANGKVYMVFGDWNDDFLDEVSVFPAGAHDDQVDALSGAYNALADEILMEATIHSYKI